MDRQSLWYMEGISLTYASKIRGSCGRCVFFFCKNVYIILLSVFIILGGPLYTEYVLGHVTLVNRTIANAA